MTTYYQPFIAVTNHSTALTDAEVANAIPAFQKAIAYRFRARWGSGGTIHFMPAGATMPSGAWVFAITDTSDQAGALAYHDVDGHDVPTASIFAKTEQQYGASWTVSLTHELWEALVDPELGACFQVSQIEVVALETADPVEADALGFTEPGLDGAPVLISAFVTPEWFVPGSPGPWAYPEAAIRAPLAISSGGYVSIGKATASGISWSEKQMRAGELVDAENPYERPIAHEDVTDEPTVKERMRRVRQRGDGRLAPHHLQFKRSLPQQATFTEA